jgi:hypothetical protein
MDLFEHLGNLTEKKIPFDPKNDEQVKSYTPFIINRFISMCEAFIPLVNEINKYDVSKEVHYNFYKSALPQRKQYFKYIKKEKDLDEEEIGYIANYFEVTAREAREYVKVLDKDVLKKIIGKYNYGNNKKQTV